jgi:hypothetical protein
MSRRLTASLLCAVSLIAGCSGAEPQAFRGRLGSGWEEGSVPVLIRARWRDENRVAPILEDGRFLIEVPGRRTYRFDVVREDGSSVPLVFERGLGLSSRYVRVYGGAPPFRFGRVDLVAPFASVGGVVPIDMQMGEAPDDWTRTTRMAVMADGSGGSGADSDGDSDSDGDDHAGSDDSDGDSDGRSDVCTGDGADSDDSDSEDDDSDDSDADSDDGDADSDAEEAEEAGGVMLALETAGVPESSPPSGIGRCDEDSDDDDSDGGDSDGDSDSD